MRFDLARDLLVYVEGVMGNLADIQLDWQHHLRVRGSRGYHRALTRYIDEEVFDHLLCRRFEELGLHQETSGTAVGDGGRLLR